MPTDSTPLFRRYRAPQEDGQTLIDPPWPDLPAILASSRQRLQGVCHDFNGRCLSELSASARCRLIAEAVAYTRQYRDLPASVADSQKDSNPQSEIRNPKSLPLVLSGHQPQLFHPGVWYKNFVLGALARQVHGVGIHFLIDSDLCRSVSIRVPTGTPAEPRTTTVPYDLPGPEIPYEERTIRDRATFDSFGDRVAELVRPLIRDPLVSVLWPHVEAQSRQQPYIGLCLAQGRHQLEAIWHNNTLELPQSAVCRMPEFAWFVAHLLAHLARFRDAYNGALATYRAAHHLRNRAQPVPDLAKSGDWLEAPLWIWSSDDPRRRPLLARQRGDVIEITDRDRRTIALHLSEDANAAAAAEQLVDLATRGIKIRTRALVTTLFARLVLGDMFLHGIGGAEYDQVTNLIARDFFGIELPEFAAVSATLRLPIGRPVVEPATKVDQQAQLRELQFHPEMYLASDNSLSADEMSSAAKIVAAKRRWIETPKSPSNARERHLAIAAANDALQPYVAQVRRRIGEQLAASEDRRRAAAILESREYSFCLYPRAHFEQMLLDGPPLGT